MGNINYKKNWYILIFMILTLGNPKFPYFGIPMFIVVLFMDFKNITKIYFSKVGIYHLSIVAFFAFLCFIRLNFNDSDLFWKNFGFIFTLSYKAYIGLYVAVLIIKAFEEKCILVYLYFQIFLISLSAIFVDIYEFLLLFQTSEAASVFNEIFGLRSVGFGVIHNEGVVLLSLIYILYSNYNKKLFGLSVFIYLIAFSSRLIFFIIPIWQLIKDKKTLFVSVTFLIFILLFFNIEDGPVYQVLEIFVHLKDTGSIGGQTVDVLKNMINFPDSYSTWIWGDGEFFSEDGFYNDTDIGFLRVLLFGGFGILFSYILICIWPVMYVFNLLNAKNAILFLVLMYVFIISNIKGVNIQVWSFFVLVHLFNKYKYRMI